MKTIKISNLRKDLYNIIDNTIEYNTPVSVLTKKGEAVILSKEEYEDIIETLYLLSIPGMKESLLENKDADDSEFTDAEEIFGSF